VPRPKPPPQAVHRGGGRHPAARLRVRDGRGARVPARRGVRPHRRGLQSGRRRANPHDQRSGPAHGGRGGGVRAQAPRGARLHVGGCVEDPAAPGLDARGVLPAGGGLHASAHRGLAHRAAVDARHDRGGHARLVPASRAMKPDYRSKIKTLEELAQAIGPRPRAKTVIMCHGMFDIVHPGHLRHLMSAKEKADLLIASLTADAHATKADFRPYVPQDLRAANLAALEMVDFVIIDPHPTSIEHIKHLQPDFFAKGYEYFAEGVPPRTQEEIDTLESYGGEIVFTPGDVVYSSSRLIESAPPKLGVEKLLALMESEGFGFDKLRQALSQVRGGRVPVVGDPIVDSYSHCSLLGATAKSPTFSVKHEKTDVFAGGAAVVAKHLKAAGGDVTFSTVLGNDAVKDFVLKDLEAAGITVHAYIDRTRPTTQKERFIADGYKMLQVDRVDNRAVSDRALRALGESLGTGSPDVVIFSDFRHGIFNRKNIRALRERIPDGTLKIADSQVSNRWGNILEFTDFDLITPNEREARFALGGQDSVVRPLAL